jgi:hypothetical protein
MTDGTEKSPSDEERYAHILAHLSEHIELLPWGMVGAETLTAEGLRAEADARWQRVMDEYLAMIKDRGWEDRPNIVEGKQQVYASWKMRSEIFLDQLAFPGTELRRFNEVGGRGGYVILHFNRPKYWLHF